MLSNEIKQQIKAAAQKSFPEEMCGVLVLIGDVVNFYQCKNISSNPTKHFELSCLDYVRCSALGKIVGLAHSQRSPTASLLDLVNYENHKLPSYIYSFDSNDIFEVTPGHIKYNKYLGRAFEIGKKDCFNLITDFYKHELDIIISDYPRNDGWYEDNPNIIQDNYLKEGFIKKSLEDIINFDILEFHRYHFGIYLEGDLVLEHKRNKFSTIEKFDNSMKRRITNVYRYGRK
jgi:proteasome lid subunit RPN8/RPN11